MPTCVPPPGAGRKARAGLRLAGGLALLAVVVSGGARVLRQAAPEAPVLGLEAPERSPRAAGPAAASLPAATPEVPAGGTYWGIVVDSGGRPVDGAKVLLVRYESGTGVDVPRFRPDGSDFDPARVARIGDYHVSGETRTGPDGRFDVTAGTPRDEVKMVVAWSDEHAPAYAFTGSAQDEVRVVLQAGGRLKGTVLDPRGQPVAGALVEVFLQQPAPRALAPEPGKEVLALPGDKRRLSAAATLGDFIGRIVGPRVYGIEPSDQMALRLSTRADGTFSVGPVDDSVQLEVVISHPDYMWTDFDEDEQGFVQRPVLRPGQVLERTYTLREGHWIAGRVVGDDPAQTGIPGVVIQVRSIPSYKKHRYYDQKPRMAITDSDGSFRVAGLSHAPYTADLFHASFGHEFQGKVAADTRNLLWVVRSRGGVLGRVSGLEERPPGGRVRLTLEPLAAGGATGAQVQAEAVLAPDDTFLLERVDPGTYRATLRAGTRAAQPVVFTIEPRSVARVDFACGGGGALEARASDAAGRVVDPVAGALRRLVEGEAPALVEELVSRAGVLAAEGVPAGRYVLELSAEGYLPAQSEPFEVRDGGLCRVGPLVLQRVARLRVGSVRDGSGRLLQVPIALEVAEGEQDYQPVLVLRGDLPLRPGPVRVRARDPEGRSFEARLVLADGEQHVLDVVLAPR
ncbi:MAG: collagen binding domain-containing protein [Planctomycetia bacterium]